jgi:hypothetical protein
MIIKEFYGTCDDGVSLYCTHFDQNLMIQKISTDNIYPEAANVENALLSISKQTNPLKNPSRN